MSFAFGAPASAPAPAASAPSAPAPSALAVAPIAPATTSAATATLPNARALFYALDATVQRGDVVDDATTSTLEDALEHVARACETYGPTRAASAEALRLGSVEYGGKTLRGERDDGEGGDGVRATIAVGRDADVRPAQTSAG